MHLGICYKSTRVFWGYATGAPGLFGNLAQELPGYLGIIWEYGTRAPWLSGNLAQDHPGYLGIWYRSTQIISEYGEGAPGLSGNMVKGHPGYLGIDVSAAPGLFGNRHECGTRVIGCQTSAAGTRVISDYEIKKKKYSRITRVPHGTEIPNNPGYNRITRVIRNFLVENPRVI